MLNEIQESNAREKAELLNQLSNQSKNSFETSSFTKHTPFENEPMLSEMDILQMQQEMDAFIQESQNYS